MQVVALALVSIRVSLTLDPIRVSLTWRIDEDDHSDEDLYEGQGSSSEGSSDEGRL